MKKDWMLNEKRLNIEWKKIENWMKKRLNIEWKKLIFQPI